METFQFLGVHHNLQSTVYVQFPINKLLHKEKVQLSQYIIQNDIFQPNFIIFNTWLRPYGSRYFDKQSINTATRTSTEKNQQTAKHVSIKYTIDHYRFVISTSNYTTHFIATSLCLGCLGSHSVKDYPSRITCKKSQRKHHIALHDDNIQERKRPTQSISPNQFPSQQQPNQTSCGASQTTPPLPHVNIISILITVSITLEFNNKIVSTYAFVDMGSCSYLQKDMAEQQFAPFDQKSERLLIGDFHQSL